MNKIWFLLVCLPLKQLTITSGYGYRVHPVTRRFALHAGIDLRAHADTVFTVTGGSVSAGYNHFLGNYIRVSSGDLQITYGHLSQIFVLTGDSVLSGTPLAITGRTGRVTGEHLHFAVSWRGRPVNPLQFLYMLCNTFNKQ